MFKRQSALPRGHRLYTSPGTLARPPWRVDNDNYDSRGRPCTWPTTPGDWLTSRSIPRTIAPAEPQTDPQYWIGARLAPANDNREDRRWQGEANYGPDADYRARQANPGKARDYEGDIISRLVAAGDYEAAFVLRQISAILSPAGLTAANDNNADDADVEMTDAFGLDYAMEQATAEAVIEVYGETGRLPDGEFKFRQRSGCGGAKAMAKQRSAEWRAPLEYLSLRGVSALPKQTHRSDGEPWRSHSPKDPASRDELDEAWNATDFRRVTWVKYAPMAARVYGALGVCSQAKGVGEGNSSAAEHRVIQELRRSAAEADFRSRMPERSLRIIDAAVARCSYSEIGECESLSRNGAKKAVLAALKEVWTVLSETTGERIPDCEKRLAA